MTEVNLIFNTSITDKLKAEIQKHGIIPPETIQTNEIIRFSDNGKRNNKDGWYKFYINSDYNNVIQA